MNKLIYPKKYGHIIDMKFLIKRNHLYGSSVKEVTKKEWIDIELNYNQRKKTIYLGMYYLIQLEEDQSIIKIDSKGYRGSKSKYLDLNKKVKLFKHPQYKYGKEFCFKLTGE